MCSIFLQDFNCYIINQGFIICRRQYFYICCKKIQAHYRSISQRGKSILLKKVEKRERRLSIEIHWCQDIISSLCFWKCHRNRQGNTFVDSRGYNTFVDKKWQQLIDQKQEQHHKPFSRKVHVILQQLKYIRKEDVKSNCLFELGSKLHDTNSEYVLL